MNSRLSPEFIFSLQHSFLEPTSLKFIGWFLVFLVTSLILYFLNRKNNSKNWLSFSFPYETYKSQSFKDDISLTLTHFFLTALIQPLWFFLRTHLILFISKGFLSFGHFQNSLSFSENIPYFLFLFLLALVFDFANFYSH